MISALGTAIGGLERSQRGLQIVAHNVARFSADGNSTQGSDPTPSYDTDRFESSGITETASERNVDLATEFVDAIRHRTGYRANAAVISVADDMLGELLDVLS